MIFLISFAILEWLNKQIIKQVIRYLQAVSKEMKVKIALDGSKEIF